ncbi:MAG: isocitrate/isopropylmalate dehydrogenase family protein, partial [Burkholderiales bacterium]
GLGKANPTAMFLSAAMMLDWLAEQHTHPRFAEAASVLEGAVDRVFGARRIIPYEFGGRDGTAEITRAVIAAIEEKAPAQ